MKRRMRRNTERDVVYTVLQQRYPKVASYSAANKIVKSAWCVPNAAETSKVVLLCDAIDKWASDNGFARG